MMLSGVLLVNINYLLLLAFIFNLSSFFFGNFWFIVSTSFVILLFNYRLSLVKRFGHHFGIGRIIWSWFWFWLLLVNFFLHFWIMLLIILMKRRRIARTIKNFCIINILIISIGVQWIASQKYTNCKRCYTQTFFRKHFKLCCLDIY